MEKAEVEKPDPKTEVHSWWAELTKPPEPGKPSRRGELAELRRCRDIAEVLFVPAFHQLFYRIAPAGWKDRPRVAAIAGLLAHVKSDIADLTVPAFLATPKAPGQGPRVSELRFRRLVAIKTREELYPALLRTIHLAGDSVPVTDLVQSVYYWNDYKRRDWTYLYYDKLLESASGPRSEGA